MLLSPNCKTRLKRIILAITLLTASAFATIPQPTIAQAEKLLYNALEVHPNVSGVGIREPAGLIVYMDCTSTDSDSIAKEAIPASYAGYPVSVYCTDTPNAKQ